jgi:hypothetical protein
MKKRARLTIVLAACLCVLALIILARTSLPGFLVRSVLERVYGYRISTGAFSLGPCLRAEASHLEIKQVRENLPAFAASRAAIETSAASALRGEIDSILLQEPKFRLSLTGDGKTDLSFLRKVPPVALLTVRKGQVRVSSKSSPYEIALTDIDLQLKGFSLSKGGHLTFAALFQVTDGGRSSATGRGHCTGRLVLTSLLPKPVGSGFIEIAFDDAKVKAVALTRAVIKLDFTLDRDRIHIYAARLTADEAVVESNSRSSRLSNITFSTGIAYNVESKALAVEQFRGEVSGLGSLNGTFNGVLKGTVPWTAHVTGSSIDFSALFAVVAPYIYGNGQRAWSIDGKGSLVADVQGSAGGSKPSLSGSATLTFLHGGFSSRDGTTAGQGINGSVVLRFSLPAGDKKAGGILSSEVFSGEYLWDTYYRDLRQEPGKFSTRANLTVDPRNRLNFDGTLDLFETGSYAYRGYVTEGDWLFVFGAGGVSLERLSTLFLGDYLKQGSPLTEGVRVKGTMDVDVETRGAGRGFHMQGTARVRDASLAVEAKSLALADATLTLPINLTFPNGHVPVKQNHGAGLIRIGSLEQGPIRLRNLNIPIASSENSLWISEPVGIPFYGGQIRLLQCRAEGIPSTKRRLYLTGTIENVDMSSLLSELTGVTLPGHVEAQFPLLGYRDGRWFAEEKTVIKAFGGEIQIADLYGENLFLSSRKFGGNIHFSGIDLGAITNTIKIGSITGIVTGSVRNLEIEYGQPSRFVLDVDSVKKRGVPQKVSVDAIENISILGTGSGAIGTVLRSGLNRFFKEYPYSQIGIRCDLENDNFHIRGKIHEGGQEYLIRRGFLRGIDVINRDPGNTVSFRDMLERIGRVFKGKEEVTTSSVSSTATN